MSLADDIKANTKFRPTAWRARRRDPWMIGWGHISGVKEGDTCTLAQGEEFLCADLAADSLRVVNIALEGK